MSEPWHECRCPRCNACPDCTDVEDRPVADAARKQAEEALTKFEQSPGTYDFYTSAWRVAECLRSLLAATPEHPSEAERLLRLTCERLIGTPVAEQSRSLADISLSLDAYCTRITANGASDGAAGGGPGGGGGVPEGQLSPA